MSKYLGKTYLYCFLVVLLNIYLANCLIEIPIKLIKVKKTPKYNIKIEMPEETSNINKTILVDKGDIKLNPSILFLANIKIGSDEQEFNLLLDTGSSILWVAGTNSQDKSELNHHYSTTSSDTCKETKEEFGVIYGTASCRGYYYTDNIKYINDKKFNMKFGVANTTDFDVDDADGIIGLANYYSNDSLSFVRMMKKGGVTDSKIFSFKLEGDKIGSKGKMYIGKHDDFSSENSVSFSLIKFNSQIDAYWIATIDGFSVKKNNNEIKSSKSCNIMFDTGTNVIMLPYDYLEDIKSDLSKVNCNVSKYSDDYDQLKCKVSSDGSLPNFRFKINNSNLTVPYNHSFYLQGTDRENYYSLVFFMKKSETYIIGSPFFITFHTLFDGDNGNLSFYSDNSDYIEKEGSKKKGLSTLAIVFIVLAVIIVLAIMGFIIYIYIKKRKERKELEEQIPLTKYNFV